jgi:isopentenyl phosphate kinase
MVYITNPLKGETILDPACGTAGFLISSFKHILKNNSSEYLKNKDDHSHLAMELISAAINSLRTTAVNSLKTSGVTTFSPIWFAFHLSTCISTVLPNPVF